MKRLALISLIALTLPGLAVAQGSQYNPRAATTAMIVTGGTAVVALPAGVLGCWITNPLSAADQGIATAENAYADETGAAATTTGNGTNNTLVPGQTIPCVPSSSKTVSINAATSGHTLSITRW